MTKIKTVARKTVLRVYEDFLMGSRLDDYRRLLASALSSGYTFLTIEQFAARVQLDQPLPDRTFVLRHDVDVDAATAARMLGIEQRLGVRSSYYVRLTTADPGLIGAIDGAGSEVGYHFEEVATVAKRLGLCRREQVLGEMPRIRDAFRDNLTRMRERSGLPMRVVASHGDFANAVIGVHNHELLDAGLRDELGILAETYDPQLAEPLTDRINDQGPPTWWNPGTPFEAIERGSPVLYLLVHPKHWRANAVTNARALRTRIWEGVWFGARGRLDDWN